MPVVVDSAPFPGPYPIHRSLHDALRSHSPMGKSDSRPHLQRRISSSPHSSNSTAPLVLISHPPSPSSLLAQSSLDGVNGSLGLTLGVDAQADSASGMDWLKRSHKISRLDPTTLPHIPLATPPVQSHRTHRSDFFWGVDHADEAPSDFSEVKAKLEDEIDKGFPPVFDRTKKTFPLILVTGGAGELLRTDLNVHLI
jgi:hypothetical protein